MSGFERSAGSQSATPDAGSGHRGRQSANVSLAPVLLSEDQAAALFGVSVRKFAGMRSEPWMPVPITLGPRLLRWSRIELEAAVDAMPRQKAPASEPLQLQLAKVRAARAGRTEVSA